MANNKAQEFQRRMNRKNSLSEEQWREEQINEGYQFWRKEAECIVGLRIIGVRLMKSEECDGWYSRPFIYILEDGTELIPTIDDECNNGGNFILLGKRSSDLNMPLSLCTFHRDDKIEGVDYVKKTEEK